METILTCPDALVRIEDFDGKHSISVEPKSEVFISAKRWVTNYPINLIEHILRIKGPAYLCDEIMRDEDPLYVQHALYWDILSYVPESEFAGKRLLDFGAGSGASSMVLARMFPKTEIVGVELVKEFVELGRQRAKFYNVEDRVSFSLSEDADTLPPDIGKFDFIVFSAVYEHLLPTERKAMLSLIWSHLNPGGIVFLDQTPYRWFPVESHTTGLPLINYLPDSLAHAIARRFSKRVKNDATWPDLLRKGIRGGTTQEILRNIDGEEREAELLVPSRLEADGPVGLWYQRSRTVRKPRTKLLAMYVFRSIAALTGVTVLPTLSLAIRKRK
jgi:2-polyprenyl-3-methyl-5-hydroxy-6-metoxy-1,4-benzoquinol methylase